MLRESPLVTKTVSELRLMLDRDNLRALPSMHHLCRDMGVSVRTIRAAVRELARQGRLRCSQGRRITVIGRKDSAAPADDHTAAGNRLFALIRARIQAGDYRVNEPLPKSAYFSIEEHVSPNTVSLAFARLRRDGLIYKKGKRWFAGKQPRMKDPAGRDRRRGTVLLITPPTWEMRNFLMSAFLVPFSNPLVHELRSHDILLQLVFFEKGDRSQNAAEEVYPSGVEEIEALVRSLDDGYMGALLYCGWGIPECATAVIRALMNFGKPVIDFDPTDKHQALAKEVVSWGKKRFYHSRFDEISAVRAALQSLADHGHRIVGLPVYTSVDYYDWVSRRVSLIEKCARQCTPEITIIREEQKEKFWRIEMPFDPAHHAEALHKAFDGSAAPSPLLGVDQRRSLRNLLLNNTPSIVNLLNTKGLTAILALNDAVAREIHLWLKYVGMRVPEEISLISFDNSVELYHLPVSTVDFGFSRLGYQVAHFFINDIPISAGPGGDMPGICTVFDKGSIGAPGVRRPLKG